MQKPGFISVPSNDSTEFNERYDCYIWAINDLQTLNTVRFWVLAVSTCGVSVIGLVLNVLAILTLTKRKSMRNVFNSLLCCLLCVDSAFLLVNLIQFTLDHITSFGNLYHLLYTYFLYPSYWITLTLSIYFTVAISHERYVAIQQPIIHRQQMKSAKSRRLRLITYVLPIIITAFVFNIPHFFELELTWQTTNNDSLSWRDKLMQKYSYLDKISGPNEKQQR